MESLVDQIRTDIQGKIDASLELRVDYSVAELEAYKDQQLGKFNWITGNYGDGGTVNGSLGIMLELSLRKLTLFSLDEFQTTVLSDNHQDFLSGINNQLAGIVAGFTHISPIDKAVMLASWQ